MGEDRIREAFQYAASGMAIADLDGRFKESNSAYREIVGRTQQELEAETVLSITHPEDRENCSEHLDRLVSGQLHSFVLEKRYVRPDGNAVWVRNSFSLLKDEEGRPSHVILICNDITERRRAEKLLVESEKLAVVGQLAASIAHEINNPPRRRFESDLSDS
jgi:PAS domain S-box-containing protein